jgi:hypothetical protein
MALNLRLSFSNCMNQPTIFFRTLLFSAKNLKKQKDLFPMDEALSNYQITQNLIGENTSHLKM